MPMHFIVGPGLIYSGLACYLVGNIYVSKVLISHKLVEWRWWGGVYLILFGCVFFPTVGDGTVLSRRESYLYRERKLK